MAKQQEKKKFYPIKLDLLNKEVDLLGRGNDFDGRHIKLDLTNNLKGRALEIKFVIKQEGDKITTHPKQAYLQGFYIRRMMRKGTDYVEDSFLAECKDHRIRIKPFLITRNRVSNRVLKGLRNKAKEEITNYIKNKSFENLVLDLMNSKLQKDLMPKLKKIYPLGLFEIKFIGIEDLKEHEKYEKEQEKTKAEEIVEEVKGKPKKTTKKIVKKSKEETEKKEKEAE